MHDTPLAQCLKTPDLRDQCATAGFEALNVSRCQVSFFHGFRKFILDVKRAYVYALFMRNSTPFFRAFGPLLFGRPPVSDFAEAFAKFSGCTSLSRLRKVFGAAIPAAFLGRRHSGENSRDRLYSLEVVFWAFLDQVQTPKGSCREVVRKIMALTRRKFPRDNATMSPSTSAYCQARAKIPLPVLDEIHEHLADRLQSRIPLEQLWYGRHVRLVDGTGISMPDTPENQALWPQSKNQKPGCGFPSMNLVGLFCLHSGAFIKAAHGDRLTHESKLFQQLWKHLNPGDLAVADRGFCSYGTFAALAARGVDSLMRLPERKIRVAIGSQLPSSANFDVTITWKRPSQCPPGLSPEQFALLPASIPVRVIRYTIAHPGFRTQCVTLITTLVDADIPANELADLYFRRWGVELHFREIKIHLNMDVLRCESPHMIEREIRMQFIAYNLIRCLMQKAALTHNVDLRRASFKGSLDTLRQFANAASGVKDKSRTLAAIIDDMLEAIARDLVPDRPGRTEPRVRKRRPKNYRLMTKPRREMGNLPHRKTGVENPPKCGLS